MPIDGDAINWTMIFLVRFFFARDRDHQRSHRYLSLEVDRQEPEMKMGMQRSAKSIRIVRRETGNRNPGATRRRSGWPDSVGFGRVRSAGRLPEPDAGS